MPRVLTPPLPAALPSFLLLSRMAGTGSTWCWWCWPLWTLLPLPLHWAS